MNFIEFKIDFLRAQVMWHDLERPITQFILTVDRHLKAGVRGAI